VNVFWRVVIAFSAWLAAGIIVSLFVGRFIAVNSEARDRRMHLEDERERNVQYRMRTGISDEDLAEFASIVARYNDVDLDEILDDGGEQP
jgi:hypothetical protein